LPTHGYDGVPCAVSSLRFDWVEEAVTSMQYETQMTCLLDKHIIDVAERSFIGQEDGNGASGNNRMRVGGPEIHIGVYPTSIPLDSSESLAWLSCGQGWKLCERMYHCTALSQ
jgi:hypothetical protein